MKTYPRDDSLRAARTAIRGEILRWNPVMNLVSRRDTPEVLDRLLDQCTEGFALAVQGITDLGITTAKIGYIDIGSGNGLPGLLWAAGLAGLGGQGPAWLVEPRKRRAWFLARVARQSISPDLTVVAGRWGDGLGGPETPRDILITLKALRLTEPEILAGMRSGFAHSGSSSDVPQRVIIMRFLGPDPRQDADLARDLQTDPAAGEPLWRQTSCRILEGPGARLLMTAYLSD